MITDPKCTFWDDVRADTIMDKQNCDFFNCCRNFTLRSFEVLLIMYRAQSRYMSMHPYIATVSGVRESDDFFTNFIPISGY